MSFAGVRTLCARAAVLALTAPLLMAAMAPVAASAHSMAPAVESESQFEFITDSQVDALPPLPCLHAAPLGCFGPDTIGSAYNIQPVHAEGINGAGRTIVIIDAFQNPAIQTDLARFDSFWNVPAPPSLNVYAPFGVPAFDLTSPLQVGWSQEISIDVEWAHATAPGAAIVLVEAKSEKDVDLVDAVGYAIRHNLGDVISQSFGEAEMCAGESLIERQHELFQEASERGITLFASSGDKGAGRQSCDGKSLIKSVSTPASDPNVTGVGGTHLMATDAGVYQTETAWNTVKGASGGGFSTLYERPSYQAPVQRNNEARGVPDVAYNADGTSGFIIVWNGRGAVVGGTSGGTPQWAGIAALADQAAGRRLGSLNKLLYHVGKSDAFHDITSGNNSFGGIIGYTAGPGWDPVTGLGSPNVANLIRLLSKKEGQDFGDADKRRGSGGEG